MAMSAAPKVVRASLGCDAAIERLLRGALGLQLLTQSTWIRKDDQEEGTWASWMDISPDGTLSVQENPQSSNGTRMLSGLGAVKGQTGTWSVTGSCLQLFLNPGNLSYTFELNWDQSAGQLWLADMPFTMAMSSL